MSTPNTEPLVSNAALDHERAMYGKLRALTADKAGVYEAQEGFTRGCVHVRDIYETHRKEWEADRAELIRQRDEALRLLDELLFAAAAAKCNRTAKNEERHIDCAKRVSEFLRSLPEPPPQQR